MGILTKILLSYIEHILSGLL